MKRLISVIGSVVVTAVLLAPATATATAPARKACDPVDVPAYRVRVQSDAERYKAGDTALMRVMVTLKSTDQTVPDAQVAVGLFPKGGNLLYGMDKTNSQGQATLAIELKEKAVRPGPVTVMAFAKTVMATTVCGDVSLYGHRIDRRAFSIEP